MFYVIEKIRGVIKILIIKNENVFFVDNLESYYLEINLF